MLAFQNIGGDREQEYFADGMAEEIITALSRIRGFFVIARNSSFTYKGRAVDVQQVGRELGVRYVLEGSVRRAGGRVRISAQLVETQAGNPIWAERYDRALADVFAVQDEISDAVATAIGPASCVIPAPWNSAPPRRVLRHGPRRRWYPVIASEAKQSSVWSAQLPGLLRFARNDGTAPASAISAIML